MIHISLANVILKRVPDQVFRKVDIFQYQLLLLMEVGMWEQFSSPDENWVFYLRVVSDASFWELFQIIDCQEAVIGRLSTRSFLRGFKFFKNYSSSASPILRLEYKVIKYHFIGYSSFKLSCYYATIVVISLASVSLRLRSVFACLVKWVTPPSQNSLKLFRNKLRCEP